MCNDLMGSRWDRRAADGNDQGKRVVICLQPAPRIVDAEGVAVLVLRDPDNIQIELCTGLP